MVRGMRATWTEGTALSRHRTAMLDANRSALTDETRAVGYRTGEFAGSSGSRSSRKKKRGLFRRAGILPPAIVMAALLVAVVYFAAQLMSPHKSGAASMYNVIDGLGHGGAAASLVAERQNIIDMSAAAKTLSVAAKPATVDPAAMNAATGGGGGGASTGGGTTIGTVAPPANPTAAEADGKAMLPKYGFDQTTQWTCLYNLWMRESSWNVYAENASGAYGIPQSLPGSKMASAGSDWQTNPVTQIAWGLGYIKSMYGTPCGAWDHEVADGWY
jgi:hypothetical protein